MSYDIYAGSPTKAFALYGISHCLFANPVVFRVFLMGLPAKQYAFYGIYHEFVVFSICFDLFFASRLGRRYSRRSHLEKETNKKRCTKLN